MRRQAAVLVAATLLASPLASAHHMNVSDPQDTRGPLDVREVRTFGRERPGWRIITYRQWSNARIWDRGTVVVRLNTRGDARANRYITVTSDGNRLQGLLWQVRPRRSDRVIDRVTVWRPNRRSVAMFVPRPRRLNIGPRRTFFAWWIQTLWSGQGCSRVCIDRVPDRGRIREPLEPEPSPSPSPPGDPSPEPSPSP